MRSLRRKKNRKLTSSQGLKPRHVAREPCRARTTVAIERPTVVEIEKPVDETKNGLESA